MIDISTLLTCILHDVISTGIIAIASMIFVKHYTKNVSFSMKMKELGFSEVSINKQSVEERKAMFSDAEEICIINVVGTHFLNENKTLIKNALSKGKRIKFLCSHPYSNFLNSIERMEINEENRDENSLITDEIFSILREFNSPLFEIRFYTDSYRLPLIIAKYKTGTVKVWMTITLPPYKSTQSFILRGESGEDTEFIAMAVTHFDSVWRAASVSLDDFNKNIVSVTQKEWSEKVKAAKQKMKAAKENGEYILIEVAAQHPLVDGIYPGEEFKGRLDEALRIANDREDVRFFVPGDLHCHNGIKDKIPLSDAGKNYLVEKGIPDEFIYTIHDISSLLGHAESIYNSTDECRVAAEIFSKYNFSKLICVCSPAQLMRKMFSYVGIGVYPEMHTFCCDNMYHDYIEEFFRAIPIVVNDKGMLTGDSNEARRLKKERS